MQLLLYMCSTRECVLHSEPEILTLWSAHNHYAAWCAEKLEGGKKNQQKTTPGSRTQNDAPFFPKDMASVWKTTDFVSTLRRHEDNKPSALRFTHTSAQQDRYCTWLPSDQLNAAKTCGLIFPLCSKLFAPAIPLICSEAGLASQGVHSAL